MRTVLSDEQVARMGAVGCGAVSQAREGEGGDSVVRCVRFRGRGGKVGDIVGGVERG